MCNVAVRRDFVGATLRDSLTNGIHTQQDNPSVPTADDYEIWKVKDDESII